MRSLSEIVASLLALAWSYTDELDGSTEKKSKKSKKEKKGKRSKRDSD